ncbi:MAG: UPF0182 family protein [Promethearchaeota archaeon]
MIYGVIIIAIIISLVIGIYVIPFWHARISLQEQLYLSKAGGLPYWEFLVLNYWATTFVFNKVGLIGAFTGCLIMTLPPEKDLISVIGTRLGFGRPSTKKSLFIWWTLGFMLFYFLGQLIDSFSNFSWVMYLIEQGILDGSPMVIFNAASVVNGSLGITHIEDVFVYNNIYLPIITFVLAIIALRIFFRILGVVYLKRNDYLLASNICFLISVFCAMYFFSIPMNSYDGLGLLQIAANPIAVVGFIVLGIYFIFLSKQAGDHFIFFERDYKKTGIAIAVLIIAILIPFFISIPTAISIDNNQSVWETQRWNKQISRQIQWTRVTAGLDMFEEKDITELIASKNSSDEEIIKIIRQFDKDAAIYAMNAYAPSPYENLADSDIVYVGGKEYWVAPKTLRTDHLAGDSKRLHSNMFDHVEGFLAIDTYSGELLNGSAINEYFYVDDSVPIFFGEHESSSLESSIYYGSSDDGDYFDLFGISASGGYGAFDDDILMNTGWQDDETNYQHVYSGEKDGSLGGLEAFWYTSGLGFYSDALNESFTKEFLINRNIKTRVANILLPGLWIDNDPYLVFNSNNQEIYYAVSICTSIPVNNLAQSNIFRFLGIALVNCLDGSLEFVENPAIVGITESEDPTYNLWKIYLEKYDWKSVNDDEYKDWLKEQLRYPEQLFEVQLGYQYDYHVEDPSVWVGGSQFYERPKGGDLFYIEFDLGTEEGLEFVGVDLVQRSTSTSADTTLAGVYILRHGQHFGECIFYKAPTTGNKMISPSKAESAYELDAKAELTLFEPYDFGNVFLYPLNDSLYYFIPTYAEEENFQVLKHAGFVEAFDFQNVGYGSDANDAYKSLPFYEKYEPPPPPPPPPVGAGNVSIEYTIDDFVYYSIINIGVEVQDNETYSQRDILTNVSVYTDNTTISRFGIEPTSSDFIWGTGGVGTNCTVIDELLYPTEGYSVSVNLTAECGSDISRTFYVRINLIVDGNTVYGDLETITIFNDDIPS